MVTYVTAIDTIWVSKCRYIAKIDFPNLASTKFSRIEIFAGKKFSRGRNFRGFRGSTILGNFAERNFRGFRGWTVFGTFRG